MNARLALFLRGAVTHVQNAKLDRKHQSQAASHANHVQQAPFPLLEAASARAASQESSP